MTVAQVASAISGYSAQCGAISKNGLLTFSGCASSRRTLAEVVEHQRRHRECEPGEADRRRCRSGPCRRTSASAPVTHSTSAPSAAKRRAGVRDQEGHRVGRAPTPTAPTGWSDDAATPSTASTPNHSTITGPKNLPTLGRAVPLHEEQRGEDHERDRHHVAVQAGRGHLEALHRGEHRHGRGDDPVAEEDGRAEDAQQQQAVAQRGPLRHRGGGQRQHRDEAAFAVVVGAQDQHDVLQRHDDRERPEHQRQHAVDVLFGERHPPVGEDLLERVQRARADVAVHDTDGAQRERREAGSGTGLGHGRPRRRGQRGLENTRGSPFCT